MCKEYDLTRVRAVFATSAFNTTVLSLPIWHFFTVVHLRENIRQENDATFHRQLLRIGNGEYGSDVPISELPVRFTSSFEEALAWLYETPNSKEDPFVPYDPRIACRRAYISPFNFDVDTINEWATERLCAMWKVTPVSILGVDTIHDDKKDESEQYVPPSMIKHLISTSREMKTIWSPLKSPRLMTFHLSIQTLRAMATLEPLLRGLVFLPMTSPRRF